MFHSKFWFPVLLIVLVAGVGSVASRATEGNDQKLREARRLFLDNNFRDALKGFEEVLVKDPGNVEALLGKMDSLAGMRRNTDAQDVAKTKTGQEPGDLILAANGKIWSRDLGNAAKDLETAIQKDAKSYLAHYLLAYLKRRDNKFDEAITHLKAAIEANPAYSESYYLLGDIYYVQGKTNEVLQFWNEYLNLVPRTGARYQYVNRTLQKLGGR